MMKRHLKALVMRQRGVLAFPLVLSRIEDMSEAEATQWYRLLKNMLDDAERNPRGRMGLVRPHIP